MATMNISMPDPMKEFVEAEVTAGGYSTASEYLRDLIRDAQQRRADVRLEALLLDGLDSGDATPMTRQDWDEVRAEVRKRISSREGTPAHG